MLLDLKIKIQLGHIKILKLFRIIKIKKYFIIKIHSNSFAYGLIEQGWC